MQNKMELYDTHKESITFRHNKAGISLRILSL